MIGGVVLAKENQKLYVYHHYMYAAINGVGYEFYERVPVAYLLELLPWVIHIYI